jgi:hypothetical protein
MTTESKQRDWRLIHTDNGEWISNDNAVILTRAKMEELKHKAQSQGIEIFFQHCYDGQYWCYRREVSQIK